MGFEPQGLVYLFSENSKYPLAGEHLLATYKQIVDEIRGLPNVRDASISAGVPLDGGYIAEDIQGVGGSKHQCRDAAVGPDYFKTLHTALLRGREFRWTDKAESGRKVILNRSAARLLFPNGSALEQRVIFEDGKTQGEVVGVVEDSKSANLRDVAPPVVYSAAMQNLMPGASLDILVRTTGSATPLIAAASRVLKRVLPDIPAPAAMSMEETIAESLVTERIMTSLALFFGGVALLITGIGLYGTLAYSTERRTGEIGIRLALGAQPKNIISMLCTENGLIAALGCFAGIAGSAFASNLIASYLYGISARDPVVLGVAAVTLLGVAAGASLLPGIKAALMDPLTAIRHE
jgi:ABC-type antimicrobial peptide transport system permease subunit